MERILCFIHINICVLHAYSTNVDYWPLMLPKGQKSKCQQCVNSSAYATDYFMDVYIFAPAPQKHPCRVSRSKHLYFIIKSWISQSPLFNPLTSCVSMVRVDRPICTIEMFQDRVASSVNPGI